MTRAAGATGARGPFHAQAIGIVGAFLTGALAALIGLAPWLGSGARLPLQNLWASPALPDQMPRALLPVSQYYTAQILGLLLAGAALASLAHRAGLTPLVRGRSTALFLGLALAQAVAVAQSFSVLRSGLGLWATRERAGPGAHPQADLYWGGMLAGSIAAMLAAWALWWLLLSPSPGRTALAAGAACAPIATWIPAWFIFAIGSWGMPAWAGLAERWLPALTVGVAVGWCLLRTTAAARTVGRITSAVVAMALFALVPSLLSVIGYGLGMRVLAGDLTAMARAAADVFVPVLRDRAGPVVLAAIIAVAVAVAGATVGRSRLKGEFPASPRTTSPDTASPGASSPGASGNHSGVSERS